MEKRTLLALAISFAFLAAYPAVLRQLYPDYYKKAAQKKAAPASSSSSKMISSDSKIGRPESLHGKSLDSAKDLVFSTGKTRLTYSSADGSIRAAAFFDYAHADSKEPLVIFDRHVSGASPGSLFFWGDRDGAAAVETLGAEDSRVVASGLSADERFRFTQTTEWSGYSAKVRLVLENASDTDQKLQYALNLGETFPARNGIDSQYLETNFYERRSDGRSHLSHIKETRDNKIVQSGPLEWLAVKDRHFALIVVPPSDGSWTGKVSGLGNHRALTQLVSPEIILAPRGHLEHEWTMYMGPVNYENLAPLKLDAIINFGKMDGISRLLVGALDLIHGLVHNYGVAIILLTLSINLLLFPLTRASFQSMKRMQALQPQMTRLREQYKNQPEKLNKEMMELYQKNKVNPFGGCLPMILQMPVFIALYVALSKSTTLINSTFLWIHDLSAPDRVSLPFSLPGLGKAIHVLPLVMAWGMAVQQRFSQAQMAGQDPAMMQQQKMMSVMMPVIFCFIFYSMPSGLVLYWLTNTVIMTLYQLSLKRAKA